MAKLLKFNISYFPNKKITDKKTGEKTTYNVVQLTLLMDNKTAPMAYSEMFNFLRGSVSLSNNNTSISISIPEEVFEKVLNGNMFQRILSVAEKNGYVADSTQIQAIEQRLNVAKAEYDGITKNDIDAISGKYLDDLISGLERDINDPRFQQILNAVHVLSSAGPLNNDSDYDILLAKTRLSVDNVISIIAQWREAGRQGIPTYLATQNQWAVFFNGTVRTNAVRLRAIRPNNVPGTTENSVLKQAGLNPRTVPNDAKVKRSLASIARGGGYNNWGSPKDEYAIMYYYDVSDVDGVSVDDIKKGITNIYSNDNQDNNTDATSGLTDTQNDAVQNLNKEDEFKKKILNYAETNNVDGVKLAVQRDGALGGLKYMIESLKPIFRERDANVKLATTEQVMFSVLRHYGVFIDEANQLFKKYLSVLRTPKGGANRDLLTGLFVFTSGIINKLEGINEAETDVFDFKEFLNDLGMTTQEFVHLPKTSEEANEITESAKNSFKDIFNKMIIAERNGR